MTKFVYYGFYVPMKGVGRFKLLLTLIIGLTGLSGCGSGMNGSDDEVEFGGTCTISSDQHRSFMAKISKFPVRVVVDSSFTSAEAKELSEVVGKWNGVGKSVAGFRLFQMTTGNVPDSVRAANPRDCAQDIGSETSFYIVRETDATRWKSLGFNDNIPGATIRCQDGKQLVHQIIFINSKLADPLQFSSIALHEVGHSLGLDHSCSDSEAPNYASCDGIKPDHPYHEAVLYPWLSVRSSAKDEPEIKNVLQDNDIARAQCLYSPK